MNNKVVRRRRRSISVIAVAVFVFLAALLSIIIVSCTSKIVAADAKGTELKLSVSWTATQYTNDNYAELTVTLNLEHNGNLKVSSREKNTLKVGDETVEFKTKSIRENTETLKTEKLYTYTFKVYRVPGTTADIPVEALWNFNGTFNGSKLETVTLSDTITLDNFTVNMKSPVITEDPNSTGPDETTEPPETPGPDETTEPTETTAPPETTEPPETTTTTPIPQPVELPEYPVNSELYFVSNTGTKYLKMRANCFIVETGEKDENGNRLATVTVELYFDYYSLDMSKREDCTLIVGNDKINFDIPSIRDFTVQQHTMGIAKHETKALVGDKIEIYAKIPFIGIRRCRNQ